MTVQSSQYNLFQQLTSARVVSTSNVAASYLNGPLNNGVGATLTPASPAALVIDGVTLVLNDRVLLVGQTNKNENGIYVVTNETWVLTRSADFQNIEQMKAGQFLSVNAGTTNAGAMYVLVEPLPAHLGIDDLNFNPTSVPSASTFLVAANDLSDVASKLTSLTNLGVKRGTTAAYAGGGTSNAFTATGLAATDIVVATILASTNSVAITKAVPTANTLTVTFSADPGAATTVQWHAIATV
jgi:hypothetical protein